MVPCLGYSNDGWLRFFRPGVHAIRFVAQRGNPAVGFVFSNLPNRPWSRHSNDAWLRFYEAWRPYDWVRCAALQHGRSVRIFKRPSGPLSSALEPGLALFLQAVGVHADWVRCAKWIRSPFSFRKKRLFFASPRIAPFRNNRANLRRLRRNPSLPLGFGPEKRL